LGRLGKTTASGDDGPVQGVFEEGVMKRTDED
jgi:hypothetical protein